MACVRSAWLQLPDGRVMPLEDEAAGYFCSSLDLGYPEVREVVDNRADNHGIIDRTQFYGSRLITVAVSAHAGAGAVIDEVYGGFAPFVALGARPSLYYTLDRAGAPLRMFTALRAANYAGPIAGPFQRDLQMQWVTADPVSRGAIERTATAWAGGGVLGRVYPLIFPRVYPMGSGGAVNGRIETDGDLPALPSLRIYGPITNPRVQMPRYGSTAGNSGNIAMNYRIDAGHFVNIDTMAHTAFLDDSPYQSVLSFIDWTTQQWPVCPPLPGYVSMQLTGTGTTSSTQVVATWRDGYLT